MMGKRVKGQSKRLCTLLFSLYLVLCCFLLPQSSTLTKAMQMAGVQSLDGMAECSGLFSAALFFLNRGFFCSWEFFSP